MAADDPWVNEYLKARPLPDYEAEADAYTDPIMRVGSESRAGVLVRILGEVSPEVGNILLRDWFSICDAIGEHRHELKQQFIRCGFVTDTEEELTLPCRIYRAGWSDDDPETGLSWTTSREKAEWFARYLTSPRAWFLGIRRDDVEPWVWTATCEEALAYFQGRGEQEVVPLKVIEPLAIAKLVSVPNE